MQVILACHPALSTKWLDWVAKWCQLWRIRTGFIWTVLGWFVQWLFSCGLPCRITSRFAVTMASKLRMRVSVTRDGQHVTRPLRTLPSLSGVTSAKKTNATISFISLRHTHTHTLYTFNYIIYSLFMIKPQAWTPTIIVQNHYHKLLLAWLQPHWV